MTTDPTLAEQARRLARYLCKRYPHRSADDIADFARKFFDPEAWAHFTSEAGLPRPTSAVQLLTVDAIRARSALETPADPFEGIEGRAAQ